jgi:hypothetical protein
VVNKEYIKKDMKKVRLTEKDLYRIVRETLNEESKGENYMFFSNLTQMRRQLDIMIKEFDPNKVNDILKRSFTFLKYYNNNYRPIYHLESMFFYIIYIIHFKKD